MISASDPTFSYVVAIGSNKPLAQGLGPVAIVDAAMAAFDSPPISLIARSAILRSAPLGPSRRRYANAVAIVETILSPPAFLTHLQDIENRHGRKRQRRWGARTLDLDIILWSGGIWSGSDLSIPHPAFRDRLFVLGPLTTIAPKWRDPVRGLTVKQLAARLSRRKPVDHQPNRL
ncbi:MAG: 2-amino-4-hydroxy-6-hydroxymethyldihydropteridine diphosphokinase [Sphingobium sp.]